MIKRRFLSPFVVVLMLSLAMAVGTMLPEVTRAYAEEATDGVAAVAEELAASDETQDKPDASTPEDTADEEATDEGGAAADEPDTALAEPAEATFAEEGLHEDEPTEKEGSAADQEPELTAAATFQPTDGTAYAVLDSEGTLTFFRSLETYENGAEGTFTDLAGTKRTGTVYAGFELLVYSKGSEVPWYLNRAAVKAVAFAADQSIAPRETAYWFNGMVNLKQMRLEGLDTSVLDDTNHMFNGCSSLVSIDFSGFNTSTVTNMGAMFYGCSSLSSLDLSHFDTSSVVNTASMFYDCSSLTALDLSRFKTSSVRNMAYMFNGCSSLASLDVSGFNTSSVTSMQSMFHGCSSLASLDVSHFDTSAVTNMAYLFDGCSSLASIDVSGFDTGNVTNMQGMFSYCSSLASLDLSRFDTARVTRMNSMFFRCTRLASLNLSGFDTRAVTDMSTMFYNCSALPSLGLSSFDTSAVTNMESMFSRCSSLASLDLSSFNTSAVTNMESLFRGCSSLGSLDLSRFSTSAVTNMESLFRGCSSLNTLGLSSFDTSAVTDADFMFDGCSALESITVGRGFETSKAFPAASSSSGWWSKMAKTWYTVNQIKSDRSGIADTYTSSALLGAGTAYAVIDADNRLTFFRSTETYGNGVSGTFVDLAGGSHSGTVYAGFETARCDNKREVPWDGIRSRVKAVSVASKQIVSPVSMAYWFSDMTGLSSADLTGFDTSAMTDMSSLFSGCSGLATLNLSDLDTSSVVAANDAFSGCSSLESVEVGPWYETSKAFPEAVAPDGWWSTHDKAWYSTSQIKTSRSGTADTYTSSVAGSGSTDGAAYAVLDSDGTLTFFRSMQTYKNGATGTFKDLAGDERTGTVYAGFEKVSYAVGKKAPWLADRTKVRAVETAAGQTVAPVSMVDWFEDMTRLERADLSGLDTSAVTSMIGLFDGCTSLAAVDLSGLNTSAATSMGAMFSGCSSLTTLDLSGFDTSSVTNMQSMFYGCAKLKSLDLSGFDTSAATDMSYMFEGCAKLASLDVSRFDTARVTTMHWMFEGCSSLASLDLSSFDTSAATDMSYMFEGCAKLASLDVSRFDTARVTDMYRMFSGCSSLVSLDVSHFDTSAVTDMASMFYGCSSLDSLDVSGFDTSAVTDMAIMFYGCSSLDSLDLSRFDTARVASMSYMFFGCTRLSTLDLTGFDTRAATDLSDMFYNCPSLASITVGKDFETSKAFPDATSTNGWWSVTDKAWYSVKQVQEDRSGIADTYTNTMAGPGKVEASYAVLDGAGTLTFFRSKEPYGNGSTGDFVDVAGTTRTGTVYTDFDAVAFASYANVPWYAKRAQVKEVAFAARQNITPVSTAYWFYGMSNLERVSLSGLNTAKATSMAGMFSGCTSLATLDLSGIDMAKVTNADGMFTGCKALTSITVGKKFATSKAFPVAPSTAGWWSKADKQWFSVDQIKASRSGIADTYVDAAEGVNPTDGAAYAVLDSDGTLTFFRSTSSYENGVTGTFADLKGTVRTGTVYAGFETATYRTAQDVPWYAQRSSVKAVAFAESKTIAPSSTAYWFAGMSGLSSVPFTDLDTSKTTTMAGMLSGCTGLTTLSLAGLDTSAATDLSHLLEGCSGLTSVDLAGLDTAKVANMAGMFSGCSRLATLDLSPLDASSLTDMSHLLENCDALASVDLSGLAAARATDVSYLFSGCGALTSLDLSGFNTSQVTSATDMFAGCSSLASITVGETFATAKAFPAATAPKGWWSTTEKAWFTTDEIKAARSGVADTYTNTSPELDPTEGTAYAVLDDEGTLTFFRSMENYANGDSGSFVDLKGTERTGTIYAGFETAVYGSSQDVPWSKRRTSVKAVACADSQLIVPSSMAYWFYGMTKLVQVDLGGIDSSHVTSMARLFHNCSALTALDLSGLKTAEVTNVTNMFYDCSSLVELDLSGFDTVKVATGKSSMYARCSSLARFVVGAFYETSKAFPSATTDKGWWSSSEKAWFTVNDIKSKRSKLADTYLSSVPEEDRIDISQVVIADIADQPYTGTEIVPSLTVTLNGVPLAKDVDYTVSCDNNVERGTATITITGIDTYKGTATKTFNIVPCSLADAQVSADACTYTGWSLRPTPTVTLGQRTLQKDVDYSVLRYENNWSVGTATIVIEGRGNYTGSASGSFEITAADISTASVEAADQVYTGDACEPAVTVVWNYWRLAEGTDYTVSYANNTDAGSATVIVTGTGNYQGEAIGSFTINPLDISDAAVTIADQTYSGKALKPAATVELFGKTLVAGEDYLAIYRNNVGSKTGTSTATVEISGMGNYTGTVMATFAIMPPAPEPAPEDEVAPDGTPTGPGASFESAEKAILNQKNDGDAQGSTHVKLVFQTTRQTKSSIKLKWNRVSGATTYVLYGNACGVKNRMKKIATLTGTKYVAKKAAGKKIAKGTYYKFVLVAVDARGKVVSTSRCLHVATKGGKVGNNKKVTTAAKRNKVALKKGKSFKLKAKAVPLSKKLRVKRHVGIRYESANSAVATVTSKGVIRGVGKGTCYVYAYSQDGKTAKVKVTVK